MNNELIFINNTHYLDHEGTVCGLGDYILSQFPVATSYCVRCINQKHYVFPIRCNSWRILLRLHGVPNPWWLAGVTSGWGTSFRSSSTYCISTYFVNTSGSSLESCCSYSVENIRRPRAGKLIRQ